MSRPIVVIVGDDDALVAEALRGAVEEALGGEDRALALEAVSYTHLTLPTIYSV